MKIDNTLAEIIVEIQKQVKDKYGIDLTFDNIVDIIDIQICATLFGFSRNIPIYWKGFIKFIWTNRRERNKDKKDLFKLVLDENNNLTPKEKEHYFYLARVNAHSAYKELEVLGTNSKALSYDEAKNLPDKSNRLKNFTVLIKNRK